MYYQHNIDPVALTLGPLTIHWYGVMYLISFILILWHGHRRIDRYSFIPWSHQQWGDCVFSHVLGVIIGGRVGYVLFYGFDEFIANPLTLFYIWQGGMSFHGGLIGVITAMVLYERKHKKRSGQFCDFVAPMVPTGLFFGRLGNFIGAELWGKPTDLPWAVIFPGHDSLPRHPSQIYEMLLEGVLLFLLLNWYASKPRPRWSISGMFLIGYGVSRIIVELVREPDAHIGYLAFGIITMGQLLSLPMIIAGAMLIVYAFSLDEPLGERLRADKATASKQTKRKKRKKK